MSSDQLRITPESVLANTTATEAPGVPFLDALPGTNPFDIMHASNAAVHAGLHTETSAAIAARAAALQAAGITAVTAIEAMDNLNTEGLTLS